MDLSVYRSLQLKRSSGIFTEVIRVDKNARNMLEHFLIVGAPPVEKGTKVTDPKIITIFPASPLAMSPDDMNMLTLHCFPNGFGKLKEKEQKKKNPLLELYTFRLGGQSCTFYGCVAKFKVMTNPIPWFASEVSIKYPFAFCIISSIPILSSHFQFLYFLVNAYHKPNEFKFNKTMLSHKPFHVIRGETLPDLLRMNGCGVWPGITPKIHFLNQVNLYRSISIKRYNKQAFPVLSTLFVHVPAAASDINLIAACCLDVLFSYLSIPDIVNLFTYALLGNYIMFQADDARLLSSSVLALRAILSPFPFQTPLIPYVINDDRFIGLLNSPVPYIAGVFKNTDLSEIEIGDQAVYVDLENGKVKGPKVIRLPNRDGLIKRLKDIIREASETITVPQKAIKKSFFSSPTWNQNYYTFFKNLDKYTMPPAFMSNHYQKYIFDQATVEKVMFAFTSHVAPEVADLIKPCFVTDTTDIDRPCTVFNRTLFLDSIPKDSKAFYTLFSQTHAFAGFCDKKTDEVDLIKMSANTEDVSPLELDDEVDF